MFDDDSRRRPGGLDALAHTLLTDDDNLGDALRRVAETGCGLLPGCAAASVTIIERGRAITMGSTSTMAQALDDAQYTAGDGPCLSAARERVLVRIDDIATEERWPEFARQAVEHGVLSSLSMPLSLSRDDTMGGFNVYGRDPAGFTDVDEELCETFATQASIVVSNAQAYWASLELSRNLSRAMQSRAEIEQAKGILMSSRRVVADDAFDLLVERSQTENRKLREVAGDVVREALEGEHA